MGDPNKPYHFVVLIHGKFYAFEAATLDKVKEIILHRDKTATLEDINLDLKLNYPNIK